MNVYGETIKFVGSFKNADTNTFKYKFYTNKGYFKHRLGVHFY